MRKLLLVILLVHGLQDAGAQTIIRKDPEIARMVTEVSADSMRAYIEGMLKFFTRHTLSVQNDPAKGIGAARDWVLQKFNAFARQSNGRMTCFIDTTTLKPDGRRVDKPTLLGNVMAVLKGTDPADDRVFVISGHLDSRNSDIMNRDRESPGANDDGSGVAAVMECARIMGSRSFPATIVFVAVSGEEQALWGSEFMAAKARAEKKRIAAVLNNDIMGSNNSNETNIIDNTRVRVFSEGLPAWRLDSVAANIRALGLENDGASRQLARYVKETGERYVDNLEVVMIYRNDRYLRGGDHTSFVTKGFTAVRITEMNENFDHQHQDVRTEKGIRYGDLIEFMDFEYLRKNTAMNLANLANLAKSADQPAEVKMDVRNLSNSTSLSWKAPKIGKPQGYYVLVRETTSPVWQKKIFTTDLEMRLPFSKDNYFFAVQSVTAAGNESLPVVPGR